MILWHFLYGDLDAACSVYFHEQYGGHLSPADFYLLGHTSRMPG